MTGSIFATIRGSARNPQRGEGVGDAFANQQEVSVTTVPKLSAALVAASTVVAMQGPAPGQAAVPPAAATSAATPQNVAVWPMNEPEGASTMQDAGPNGLSGKIGEAVATGATSSGSTGYHWAFTQPNAAPPKPERLVVVKDDDRLDPGRGFYSVTVRYRTTHSFGNLLQKGQAGAAGGYWKIQLPHGIAQCFFRGPNGNLGASSPDPLDDGAWHLVRCERTSTGITMTVDGEVVEEKEGTTGPIDNDRPLTIGGKKACDQVEVTCDYFSGDIDKIRIRT